MQIIIVGCGKVGRTLAEQLQEEDTDITLIDINPDRINEITDEVDAMGVVGNGASINTLMEARIETADILIAVTVSDEMNLQGASGCNHDHQPGTGSSPGDFKTSAFSIRHKDRYFCQRQGRTSEI